jgi:hypothetical protein
VPSFRRFSTAEWLVKPESILILLFSSKSNVDSGFRRNDEQKTEAGQA